MLFNGHLQTVYPALVRKHNSVVYTRERIDTPDGDFLDLDWCKKGNKKLVILSHGLEGSSYRQYITGMVQEMIRQHYDTLAWNFRGCSGETNKALIMYHSGATDDLRSVVNYAAPMYEKIHLIGFSLGGNLTLKYLGERELHHKVRRAVVFSVPLDLKSGAENLSKLSNKIYELRFLKSLSRKIIQKKKQYPNQVDLSRLKKIRRVYDFDDIYTAPIHGFKDAEDYYHQCSSRYFLDEIVIPTLIVNAKNDPLLTRESLDPALALSNPNITFELPDHGGHCGFPGLMDGTSYWSEKRASAFFSE